MIDIGGLSEAGSASKAAFASPSNPSFLFSVVLVQSNMSSF
jgi:hypothetical protein